MVGFVRRHQALAAAVLAAFWLAVCPAANAMADAVQFDIAAQSMPQALKRFAAQAHVQLLFDFKGVEALQAPAVRGRLEADDALGILLKGTGFTFQKVNDHTIAISRVMPTSDAQQGVSLGAGADGPLSGSVILAQATAGQEQGTASPEKPRDDQTRKPPIQEVVVTGSRIPTPAKERAQQVSTYSKEDIDRSGQTTVADFLNTLPAVSLATTEGGLQALAGQTSVALHGLPVGTTLVLINGRRVEDSGITTGNFSTAQNFFDLNNIPLSAVERIEVVPQGSSAIYGSDAIAGVVNIILRKDISGLEASVKYGFADGTNEWDSNLAWGAHNDRGAVSVIASFQSKNGLLGEDRAVTSTMDHSSAGGQDAREYNCDLPNIYSTNGGTLPGLNAPYAGVPAGYKGPPSVQEFVGTSGILNRCSPYAGSSAIPDSRRESLYAQAHYDVTPSVELFTELLYSHVELDFTDVPYPIAGQPGFQLYTVAAANPFNPFGEAVGVSGAWQNQVIHSLADSDFFRPLIGIRGEFASDWRWEFTAWDSHDHERLTQTNEVTDAAAIQAAFNSSDPTVALNPFVDGPLGSPQLIQSFFQDFVQRYSGEDIGSNAFVQGPLLHLPSGPVQAVFGAAYDRDSLHTDNGNYPSFTFPSPPGTPTTFHRDVYALYAETRVPIIANRAQPEVGETLALTAAARMDHYSDFGSTTNPQFGLEWRPVETLLIRGTYAKSFKAPPLYDLYAGQTDFYPFTGVDPKHGNAGIVFTNIEGGNPGLRPETGASKTVGFIYSRREDPALRLSVTYWDINESNNIQALSAQTIIDNEAQFPGLVTRNSAGAITSVNSIDTNFGSIDVRGFDYEVKYALHTAYGDWLPSLNATQTVHYQTVLIPGAPAVSALSRAQDNGNWAPQLKGTVALGWQLAPYSASLDARYVGRYQDYDSTRGIGNFWLCDANMRLLLGRALGSSSAYLKNTSVEIGGVNIFNRLPQVSNYQYGVLGYDPAQADIRGRFLYGRLSVQW